MNAFNVFYETGDKQTSMTVLVKKESNLRRALSQKDKDFKEKSQYSTIIDFQEIPLSNVLVSDLSVSELSYIMENKTGATHTHIHRKYCFNTTELDEFLKKLTPDELITIIDNDGYTIVWKSDKENDVR